MRVVLLLVVAIVLGSGCLTEAPVATIAWLDYPEQVEAGQQFSVSYEIARHGTLGHHGGFANATHTAVWATPGDAEPATLEHYYISTAPTSLSTPEPCTSPDGNQRHLGCTKNDLIVLRTPGTFWLRARALVDGVEVWSQPIQIVVT